jgi:hypothetical protein
MRSSVALCVLDCSLCARAHITAQEAHGVAGEAMAARATRDMWLMWHALERNAIWLCCMRSFFAGLKRKCDRAHW